MANKIPVVEYSLCATCGVSVTACPFSCLELSKVGIDRYNKVYPVLASPGTCTGCGICAKACPVEVITMQVLAGVP